MHVSTDHELVGVPTGNWRKGILQLREATTTTPFVLYWALIRRGNWLPGPPRDCLEYSGVVFARTSTTWGAASPTLKILAVHNIGWDKGNDILMAISHRLGRPI